MITDELLTIDEVAFAPPFPNPAPTDALGDLVWLSLDELRIDPKYQRPIGPKGEKNIRQVIENFSWSLFSPLVVCRRPGGLYAVIDGQHRAIAARTHGGIDNVPCLVINGDLSDEAKAFSVINGAVTRISDLTLWHARKVAGDSTVVRIEALFDMVGVFVPRSQKNASAMKKGETLAVGAIERIYKSFGGDVLLLTLRTVVETKDGNPGLLIAPLLKGTATVLDEDVRWRNRDAVIRAIKTVGIKYLIEKATIKAPTEKLTVQAAYASLLRDLLKKEIK